jgi:ribosomal protein S18 acetylase RimI-like enzyme
MERYQGICEKLFGPGLKRASYHLQVLGILPEYQKRGIGKALIDHVATKVRIKLRSTEHNNALF